MELGRALGGEGPVRARRLTFCHAVPNGDGRDERSQHALYFADAPGGQRGRAAKVTTLVGPALRGHVAHEVVRRRSGALRCLHYVPAR